MEPEALTARGTLRRQRIATGAGGHSSSRPGAVIYGGTGEQRFDRGTWSEVGRGPVRNLWLIAGLKGFGGLGGGGGGDTKCLVSRYNII